MRLLIAEDDTDISKALTALLAHNNYRTDAVCNGNDAYDYALEGNYDGIILDIMMPGMDGLQVLQALRKNGIKTPVLLLTAKGEIEDRVNGLDAGADDYLPKPFAATELLARVRAMLRRKEMFMERIWGWDSDVEVSIVWVYISNLRKKLEKLGANVTIKAVRGVGYCLEKK